MAEQATTTAETTTEEPRLQSYQVILRPLVTEKGMHRSTRNNQYAFEVHSHATKHDVRRAVEDLFNVKVTAVNTLRVKGKVKRFRGFVGQRSDYKKAIVTLAEGSKIDVTTGI